MATMKLTTLQMERELNYKNESLFDDFAFPTDPDTLFDHATLKNRILMRCGEFEVLYSDPDVYKLAVEVWSNAYKRTFDKWLAAVFSDYNPIENYNMRERFQDDGTMSGNDSKSASNSASGSGSFNGTIVNNQTSGANGTSTHNVSAYDASDFSPESQNVTVDSATADATETNTNTTTSSTSGEASESGTKSEQTQNIHVGERSGNIGVTTSQQMLEQEFKVALFSIYDRIADLFVHEFCIMLY